MGNYTHMIITIVKLLIKQYGIQCEQHSFKFWWNILEYCVKNFHKYHEYYGTINLLSAFLKVLNN